MDKLLRKEISYYEFAYIDIFCAMGSKQRHV